MKKIDGIGKMVAISLYRGNLHRVPDVPRRWLMPTPKISLRDFRSLLHRRSKALSRLHSPTTTSSNPNPSSYSDQPNGAPKEEPSFVEPKLEAEKLGDCGEGPSGEEKDQKDQGVPDGRGDCPVKLVDASDPLPEKASGAVDGVADEKDLPVETKPADLANPNLEILNAEEELKRRNSMQGMAIRPSVPLQVDATNDTGSLTRHVTPRTGSEGNLAGDMEGGEADDPLNHNIHSRHMLRTSSMSPSSESPLRRPAYNQPNMVSLPSRATIGASGSPSRFAPAGHQGNPANLPTLSVSGTNYVASSPSPAASGGTSAFRDTRLPSPWN